MTYLSHSRFWKFLRPHLMILSSIDSLKNEKYLDHRLWILSRRKVGIQNQFYNFETYKFKFITFESFHSGLWIDSYHNPVENWRKKIHFRVHVFTIFNDYDEIFASKQGSVDDHRAQWTVIFKNWHLFAMKLFIKK